MSIASDHVPWTSEQREWLQALGYDVLALVPVGTEAPQGADAVAAAPAPAKPQPQTRTAASKPVSTVPPLLRALARAAGRNEDDPELLKTVPDLTLLRGNAAARKALWPRLRALRKGASQ